MAKRIHRRIYRRIHRIGCMSLRTQTRFDVEEVERA
jgi:hypothetical protein